jgi:hypothetical protein
MPSLPDLLFSPCASGPEDAGQIPELFFKDLGSKLAQWAGINLSDTKLGTIDSRVQHSHDWDTELSRGLSENRAFLAIIGGRACASVLSSKRIGPRSAWPG